MSGLDPAPRRQILEGVLDRFLHHLLHRRIIHVHGGFHLHDCLPAGLGVARQHVQNAVRVNLELHADPRHAVRRGFKIDREPAQAPVVLRRARVRPAARG